MPMRLFNSVDLPAPLRPEQRNDLLLAHVERDAIEDVALAVEGVDAVDREKLFGPCRARRAALAAIVAVPEPM